MERLRIGEMAKRNNVTEQTLRYYDKMGLMSPCEIDPMTGYRYYNPKQSIQLDLIHYMKSMGLSLLEIKNQMDTGNIEYMKEMLTQQLSSIQDQIRDLNNQMVKISHALDSYYNYDHFPPEGTIVFEHIPTRYVFSMTIPENVYSREDDYYNDCGRELGRRMASAGIPFIEFCNMGTVMKLENFIQKKMEAYEMFTFIDPYYADYPGVYKIHQATYLCVYCTDYTQEGRYIEKLHEELKRQNLEPAGDYLCEDMVNLPFVNENKRSMFLRLQIPVRFPRTTT